MAEELRELTVRLSLSADNFSRNIKSINQQVKQAEARFKEMGAGSKTFGTSVQGLTARLTMLRERLNMQRASVAQYEQALAKANTSLTTARDKHAGLEKRLEAEHQCQAQLKTAVDQARKAHEDAIKTYGENSDEANALGMELLELEGNYKDSGKAVKDLESKLTAQQRTMQNASDKAASWQTRLSEAQAEVKNLEKQITNINPHLDAFAAKMDAWSTNLGKTGKTMQSVGKTLTGYITTPVVGLGGFAMKSSIEFEDAFAGVRKTVDATEEEYRQLEQAVKEMSSNEVPSDPAEISEVMATAGQLGIYTENLRDYSKTMIDLGESTDIVANDAAKIIAQFFNITGTGQGKVRNFGSALVDLGNNFATTESAIMNMASRLAGAGAQIGLTDAQILGFATGLSSVGIEAEAGGSAFSKVMTQMQVAVETNNAALADFARVSGMTSEQFVQAWKQDSADAIQAFIVGLSGMSEEGVSAIATLEDMGLTEIRLRDTLLRATNASELFDRALQTANVAWEENTALTDEAEARYSTTASRLQMLKNRASVAATELGDELAPAFAETIEWAEGLIDKFADLDTAQKEQIIKWAAIAAAVGPALIVFGKVSTGAGQLLGVIGKLGKDLGKATTAFREAGGGLDGFVAALGASKVGVLALTATLGYGIYAWIDWASGAKAAREATERMIEVADEWKNTVAETFYDRSPGLAAFGIDTSAFATSVKSSEDWLDELYAVWSDGEKETDEIVDAFANGFSASSDRVRDALTTLSGETSSGSLKTEIQEDIEELDKLDERVAELLKNKQNGLFSEADKAELEDLIEQREAIVVKYRLEEDTGSGFDQIAMGVEAAIARAKAENEGKGDGTDIGIYEDALKAGAEGMAAYNKELADRYDAEYAIISAMEEGAEKEQAFAELNEGYNQQRKAAAQEYIALLQQTAPELFAGEGMEKAGEQLMALQGLLKEYEVLEAGGEDTSGILGEIADLTEQMDEGQLASYITALTQLQDAANQAGVDVNELFPDLDVTELLGGYESIGEMLSDHAGEFPGLNEMFGGALAEEVMRVQAELDFGEETPTVDVVANVTGYELGEDTVVPTPEVDANVNPRMTALAKVNFRRNNKISGLEGRVNFVRFSEGLTPEAIRTQLESGSAVFTDGNGLSVDVGIGDIEEIYPNMIFQGAETDEDGSITYYYQIVPKVGSVEAAKLAIENYESKPDNWLPDILKSDTGLNVSRLSNEIAMIEDYQEKIASLEESGKTFDELGLSVSDYEGMINETLMGAWPYFENLAGSEEQLRGIADVIATVIAAVKSGEMTEEEGSAILEPIEGLLGFVDSHSNELGTVGENISAGIAGGLAQYYGWETDAATLATSVETAIQNAFQEHSPSQLMVPHGVNLSAGIGEGVKQYDFSDDASTLAGKLNSAMSAYMSTRLLRPVGINAMLGLVAGINAGRSGVIAAMRSAARDAVKAAKNELKIKSPSAVFAEEVGAMAMKGFGQGILTESPEQAKIIRNAMRFMVDTASTEADKTGRITTNNDYRNQSATINIGTYNAKNEEDIDRLARRINARSKSIGKGYGHG